MMAERVAERRDALHFQSGPPFPLRPFASMILAYLTRASTRTGPAAIVSLYGCGGRRLRPGQQISSIAIQRAFATQSGSFADARPQVLLLDEIELAKDELSELEKQAEILRLASSTRNEFVEDLKAKYSNIRAIYRHFGGARSIKITGRFDEELVSALPRTLQAICHNGAGYDQLDIAALTARKISVSNVPTAVDDATSDTALFLLLGSLRRFAEAQAALRSGKFNADFPYRTAHDPRGLTLGIVGMGGIGRALARKASTALGMRVQYMNRNRLDEKLERESGNASFVASLPELLSTSDVVSLHCPLTPQTRGLIGTKELQMMRPDAVLINTARGPVVKEEELADALERGVIAQAGLDVYEAEPSIHPRLLALRDTRALLLPHVGTLTLETQREMEAVCLRNIRHALEHDGRLAFTVPEQKDLFVGP